MKVVRVAFATTAFLSCCLACSISASAAKEVFPIAILTASDGTAGAGFGAAVSLDGNTLVVGAPYSGRPGSAYVFINSEGVWTQAAELTASDGETGAQFGFSVAISGNTVTVGAPEAGVVYVFVKPVDGWANMTETAQLTYEGIGYAVAGGDKGRIVVAGSFFGEAAYVFNEPRTGWGNMSAPTATLVTPPDSGGFGSALAMSGSTVAVGANTTSDSRGAVYIFLLRPGDSNIESVAMLTASDNNTFLGNSVAIDGGTVIAAAPGQGGTYLFVEPPTGWADMTQTAKFGVKAARLAASVAVSDKALVAGAGSRSLNASVAYLKPPTGWADSSTPEFWATSSDASDAFGSAIALDSTTVAVGDFDGNQSQGAVYIFAKP